MITPKNYQVPAISKGLEALRMYGKALLVMATGLGKTVVAAFMTKGEILSQGKVLFLCHDSRILKQARKSFSEIIGQDCTHGEFHGKQKDHDDVNVIFATFQTMKDWKNAFFEDEFATIIVDEGHHSQAVTFKSVIEYFKPKYMFALTATPDRTDGLDIRDLFGEEVVNISLEEALANRWLPQVEYRVLSDGISRGVLKKLTKDIVEDGKKVSIKQLNETIFIKKRDEEVVRIIQEQEQKQGIIFCESIAHAHEFQKSLPSSVTLHSKMSQKAQDKAHEGFKAGVYSYILVIDKYNEGVDVPETDLIVFLRCTDSRRIFLQQLGRGLHCTDTDKKVLVLDFVANCDRIQMIKELTDKVLFFVPDWAKLDKTPLHVSGEGFDFVFDEEQIQLLEILRSLKPTYISDIPHLLAEYHPTKNELPADQVSTRTNDKIWWICSKDSRHEWDTRASHRSSGAGCPFCSNQKIHPQTNSLAVTHPNLAKEYHPTKNELPADQVFAGTNKKLWWKCSKDSRHEWQSSGSSRSSQKTGCPFCSNKRIDPKTNSLAVTHPELAKEYHPTKNELPADQVIAGTDKKRWWICSEDNSHEWQATGYARVYQKTGCPFCSSKRVDSKTNSLAIIHPELAKEYHPTKNELPADQVFAGTNKKLWWKCLKDSRHEWQASAHHRGSGKGCPFCSNKRIDPKTNSLAVTHPNLAKEYHPTKNELPADQVIAGTRQNLWWRCLKDPSHEWEMKGYKRVAGLNCPYCTNNKKYFYHRFKK